MTSIMNKAARQLGELGVGSDTMGLMDHLLTNFSHSFRRGVEPGMAGHQMMCMAMLVSSEVSRVGDMRDDSARTQEAYRLAIAYMEAALGTMEVES